METTKTSDMNKDPRLINCKTECGNEHCFAKRYGLFAEKTCPNFKEPSIITNADRLRGMSDEELAGWYCRFRECTKCPHANGCRVVGEGILDWLKQEATDG